MDGIEEQKGSVPPTKAPKKRRVVKKPDEGQMKLSFGGAAEQEIDEEMKQAMIIAAQADAEELGLDKENEEEESEFKLETKDLR